MKTKTVTIFLLGLSMLAMIALSCSLVSRVGEIKATGEALATDVETGREYLGTGQAFVTQIEGSGPIETVKAAVTQIGEGGAKETLSALATEIAGKGLSETLQAGVTELPGFSGEKPADIPIFGDGVSDLIATQNVISYLVSGEFQDLVDFYNREMPANGWKKIDQDSSIKDNLATLVFEKEHRRASMIITKIPFINQLTVMINIETR